MSFRELKPDEWILEISRGTDYRAKFGLEGTWGELESLYYNVHPSMANDGPNILMSTGDSLLSSLNVPTPRYMVRPARPEAVSKATLVETVDNLLLRDMRLRDEVDTATLHAFLFGTGIIKFGYDSEFGFDPRLDIAGVLQLGMTLSQVDRKGDKRIEYDSSVSPGMPWAKAVPPHDIVVPWGTKSLDSCPWVAHRFVRHLEDLKQDRKYSNTRNLNAQLSMEDFVDSYRAMVRISETSTSSTTKERQRKAGRRRPYSMRETDYVELYEIHDRRTGRIIVVCPGHGAFLRNDRNALQVEGRVPFAAISFTPRSRAFWTTSDAYYLRESQMELSDLAVQRTKIRRLAVLKFLYDESVIEETELAKLISPDVGAAAKINGGEEITKAILPFNTHPDQTLILEEEHLRRNVREQIGFSRNQMGEFTGGRRTATEASIVDGASQLRMSRRGQAIKRLYEDSIQIINGIIFEHWTTPRVVQVLGPEEEPVWQTITGPGLKSRYSYDIVFTDDAELRRRGMEALQLYMTLTQDPSIDPVMLRRYLADQINDPQFERLFNADISDAMRALRLREGVVSQANPPQSQGQSNGMAQMLPTSNGASAGAGLQGLLAGRGNNS